MTSCGLGRLGGVSAVQRRVWSPLEPPHVKTSPGGCMFHNPPLGGVEFRFLFFSTHLYSLYLNGRTPVILRIHCLLLGRKLRNLPSKHTHTHTHTRARTPTGTHAHTLFFTGKTFHCCFFIKNVSFTSKCRLFWTQTV